MSQILEFASKTQSKQVQDYNTKHYK